MAHRLRIPLRNRDSFFQDPYFADSWDWDPMDRLVLSSRGRFPDIDDFGVRRGLGLKSGIFDRSNEKVRDILLEKDLKSSQAQDLKTSQSQIKTGSATDDLQSDNETFKVLLDVQQFKPEEVSVTVNNGLLVIEGNHEEKADSLGFVSRRFTRSYNVPSDVKVEDLQCNLSSDGVLQVRAPRSAASVKSAASASTENASSNVEIKKSETTSTSAANSSSTTEASSATQASASAAANGKAEASERIDNKSSRFKRQNSTFLGDIDSFFDPYFAGFTDFDELPFWRRRRGLNSELIDSEKQNVSSSRKTAVLSDREYFKIQLDVQQFTPEELTTKAVDNFLIVEGKHEEKKDSLGSATRHFIRKFEIPSDVNVADLHVTFTKTGLLIISAPRKSAESQSVSGKETQVQIQVNQSQSQTEQQQQASKQQTEQQGSATSPIQGSQSGNERLIQIQQNQQQSNAKGLGGATGGNRGDTLIQIRLDKDLNQDSLTSARSGAVSSSKDSKNSSDHSSTQNQGEKEREGKEFKEPEYKSNLVNMIEAFSEELKAVDPNIAAAAASAPKEPEETKPSNYPSHLMDMLGDFSDKLKSLSTPAYQA